MYNKKNSFFNGGIIWSYLFEKSNSERRVGEMFIYYMLDVGVEVYPSYINEFAIGEPASVFEIGCLIYGFIQFVHTRTESDEHTRKS